MLWYSLLLRWNVFVLWCASVIVVFILAPIFPDWQTCFWLLDIVKQVLDSRPIRYQVTTLGKLFKPTCLCRCTWSSGWCRLVTFSLWFDSHCGSFASNLEQVAALLCAQVNSASSPQWDGKWVVAYGRWGEVLVWLIGVVVCLLAADCITAGPVVCSSGQWMAA